MNYLLIQAIGFVGTILFFLSYQCRSNRNLFRMQFISYFCYMLHLILLGAATGGISHILNCLRSFCLGSDIKQLRTWKMCILICVLQLIALALTWDGAISLLPVIANMALTIGAYTYNPRKIRITGMFINSPLWIIYDVIVGSWSGILDEVITEASMIISIIRFGWKDLDKTAD